MAAGKSCLHFTQVVWSTTTKVGCGKARTADGMTDFVVCDYSPPGNIGQQAPFKAIMFPTSPHGLTMTTLSLRLLSIMITCLSQLKCRQHQMCRPPRRQESAQSASRLRPRPRPPLPKLNVTFALPCSSLRQKWIS
ncbi:MAG: hypothetical protein IPO41_02100 [Acidobacteria bacterium]|nr:hypothetical protein [Acidobacteriota bacterium]